MTKPIDVTEVRFEHQRETLGMGTARPRLSWRVDTSAEGWAQAAYEIEVYDASGKKSGSTGRVNSAESVLVSWPFAALKSRERVSVSVRVWGQDGAASGWSPLASVEAGLLDAADWTARFVRPDWEEDTDQPQPGALDPGRGHGGEQVDQALQGHVRAVGDDDPPRLALDPRQGFEELRVDAVRHDP